MSAKDPQTVLNGWSVLVTRPREQAEGLCQMIEHAGGKPLRFPVIDILPGSDQSGLHELLDRLDQFDLAIFVSANAVRFMFELLPDQYTRPAGLDIAAVGRSTASTLEQFGWHADLVPESNFNSEALLAMPALQQVAGRRIIIVRGEGGRPLLGDTLIERGAQLSYANVYRRALPELDVQTHLAPWLQASKRAVIITSEQGLDNLIILLDDQAQAYLRHTPFVVISERVLKKAHAKGLQAAAVVAETASDDAIVQALIRLSRQQDS